MIEAKKTESGSWRIRAYDHTEKILQPDGTYKNKQIYKCFTCLDPSKRGKKLLEAEVAQWQLERDKKKKKIVSKTFGECLDDYIDSRENILSKRTIMEYRKIRRSAMQEIMNMKIDSIDQNYVQKLVDKESKTHKPKTIKNWHGIIYSVMKEYAGVVLTTKLPRKTASNLHVPTESEVNRIMEVVKGTDLELPCLLAMFGPMRRGEIAALRKENINGNVVHVCENMVMAESDEEGKKTEWIIKTPKSEDGDRYIEFPDFVAEHWKDIKSGRLVSQNPNMITNQFIRVLKKNGIQHMRFHDLRHFSASYQHAMGIPDAYIMKRGGWKNDGVLKQVYRHAMEEEEKRNSDKINDIFSEKFAQK